MHYGINFPKPGERPDLERLEARGYLVMLVLATVFVVCWFTIVV